MDNNVLSLFDSDDDEIFNAMENTERNQEKIFLKFIPTGSTSSKSLQLGTLDFLIAQNISVSAVFIKGLRSFLFEVLLNSSFKSFLVKLFEERSSASLTETAAKNIVKLSTGKFKVIIENTVLFLVIIPDVSCIEFPCQQSQQHSIPCNSDIFNIFAGKIMDNNSNILRQYISAYSNDSLKDLVGLIGIRIEATQVSQHSSIRLLFKNPNLNEKALKLLNETYGQISFSSTTLHAIPSKLFAAINKAIDTNGTIVRYWRSIVKNDIIICRGNEIEIVHKGDLNTRQSKVNPNHRPVHTSINQTPSTSANIFSRLGPPYSATNSNKPPVPIKRPTFVSVDSDSSDSEPKKLKSTVYIPKKHKN